MTVTCDRGGFGRGLSLTRNAWQLIGRDRRLLVLPAAAALAAALAAAILFGVAYHYGRRDHSWLPYLIAVAVGAYPLNAIVTFCNVAFVAASALALDGRPTSPRLGLSAAFERLGCILRWAAAATLVGLLVRVAGRLPGGALVVLAVQWLLGIAWGVATMFVIPVMAFERCGVREVLGRSVGLVRRRWGETVSGSAAIGAVVVLALLLPLAVLGAIGAALIERRDQAGVVLVGIAVVLFVAGMVIASALSEAFQLVLYRYAAHGTITGAFSEQDLQGAVRQRPQRAGRGWLQRRLSRP